ncbi:MAG: SemiSWEET family transporter [Pyrinomonadaceae bacterium]|nr:SemiSWEET family transporter [Pyrinomonadaceae bacterium]
MTELIGWASSMVLFLTVIRQVQKQWRTGTNEGVSKWLFVGQLTASAGFLLYSWLTGSWVFAVTNAVLTASNAVGIYIYFRNRDN